MISTSMIQQVLLLGIVICLMSGTVSAQTMVVSPYGSRSMQGQRPVTLAAAQGGVLSVWNLSAGNNRYEYPDALISSHPALERTDILVYAGWFVDPEDPDNPDLRDGYFACSKDGGVTYSIGRKFGTFDLKDPESQDHERGFLYLTSHKSEGNAHYFVSAKDGIWHSTSLANTTTCSVSTAELIYETSAASNFGVYTDNISSVYTDLQISAAASTPAFALAFNEVYETDSVNDPNDDPNNPLDARISFLVSRDGGMTWDLDLNDLYHDSNPLATFDGIKLNHRVKTPSEKYLHLGFIHNGEVYIDEGLFTPFDLSWHTETLGTPLIGFPSGSSDKVSFDFKVGLDSTEAFLVVQTQGLDTEGITGFASDHMRKDSFEVGNFPVTDYTLSTPTSMLSTIIEQSYYSGEWGLDGETATDLIAVGLTSTPEYLDQVKGVILDAGTLDGDAKVLLYDTYDDSFMAADLFDPGEITSFLGKPKVVSFPSYPGCATGGFIFSYTVDETIDPTGVIHNTPEVIAGSYCLP